MASKLIVNLNASALTSTVEIQEDGDPPVKLKRVSRLVITADADNEHIPMAELTMYAGDFQGDVVISDATAEAIVLHERIKQLSFLSDADHGALSELMATLLNVKGWPSDDPRLKPLKKILDVLAARTDMAIPF